MDSTIHILEQPGPGRQRSRCLKLAYISTVERRLKPRARVPNGVFSLTWPASMQIYWNKRKRLHKKRVQLQ